MRGVPIRLGRGEFVLSTGPRLIAKNVVMKGVPTEPRRNWVCAIDMGQSVHLLKLAVKKDVPTKFRSKECASSTMTIM